MTAAPYVPEPLPPAGIDWEIHIPQIASANRALARYDGILQAIPNPELLLSPLLTQEAVLSSKIEGTQASLEDVLRFEANPRERINDRTLAEIQEIINYREGLNVAVDALKARRLDTALVCNLHRILLADSRGMDREPGCIRTIQNFIGRDAHIERAIFVPPAPERVPGALADWEAYLHREEKDILVQLSILKAQFELIHPFCDGNGRIGRMLVPLIMYEKGLIGSPMFYISAYLERNRPVYYERLLAVSREGDWNGWITFFLHAIEEQAGANGRKAKAILDLYDEMKRTVPEVTRSQYAVAAIDALFATPIFIPSEFYEQTGIPKKTANRLLQQLREQEIITVVAEGGGRRATTYMVSRLLAITEEDRL
ncbi:Fic family protein [Methanoculleus horonobensis]|jgi:Fic family protein|uniref:Fic family protein n=1 Tax=Methanoculleus horonobensis TaxID=528314 RepID=UPI000834EF33|nr:Fic/DOC family N-terminal domain-containing protein [Methanoculleus horonobensis]MDD3069679.1 Fic/DOC family N-terminal domain-containing protein [Methanoculleus horonobensis]MDD4252851.1 Fic/DOC family N-terminal domain-containing protein [Methanoculleus horonobensis]